MHPEQQTERKDPLLVEQGAGHGFVPRIYGREQSTEEEYGLETSQMRHSTPWQKVKKQVTEKSRTQIVLLMAIVAVLVVLLPFSLSMFLDDPLVVKALVVGFVVLMILLILVVLGIRTFVT